MKNPSNQIFILVLIATLGFAASLKAPGLQCSSCGDECFDACGTRFFRTCCFNYLRKRSSPPMHPTGLEFEENAIWMNKAELEKLVHNELIQQENLLSQKGPKKDDFQKSATNQIDLNNNHDHVIYDI